MQAKAIAKYVRTSPRKAGYVCSLVRGKIISKVVASAAANAENNNNMDREKLYVAEIYANQGPTLKRFMPRAQGRATGIRKRTSHIGVTVQER